MSAESHLLARHTIFTDIYRWTAVWLTVHTGMAVNAPPIESVQNVYWMVGSGLKLGKTKHGNYICQSETSFYQIT